MHIFEIYMVGEEICMGAESIYDKCAFSSLKKKINIYLFLTFFIINIFQQFQKFCKEHICALRFLHSFRENCVLARRENCFKLKKSIFSAILTPSPGLTTMENARTNTEKMGFWRCEIGKCSNTPRSCSLPILVPNGLEKKWFGLYKPKTWYLPSLQRGRP